MTDDKRDLTTLDKVKLVIEDVYNRLSTQKALERHNINHKTFWNALDRSPDLLAEYERAQQSAAEARAEEIVDIADNKEVDPHRARNMIDARKWYASKMKPSKFGDRIDLNVNQTVDIKGAMDLARQRILLPPSYPENETGSQVIEMKDVTPTEQPGLEPVTPRDAPENALDDIFS